MIFDGYEINEKKDKVIVNNIKDFNLTHIFECGQCFRWTKLDDGSFNGIVREKAVNVAQEDETLIIKNSNIDDFKNIWYDYFDLGRDYGEIKKKLSEKDETLNKAVEFGYGIRLLKQEFWELLMSFIISANNRIPMIIRAVNRICKEYGNEINFVNQELYGFPKIEKLAKVSEEEFRNFGVGFRGKYLDKTSTLFNENPITVDELKKMNIKNARELLMKFPGVGPKVADCVLLFSGVDYDVFPTDVWVKRIMSELYFKEETSIKKIQEFSKSYFDNISGFAQQYLFYYARSNLGMRK